MPRRQAHRCRRRQREASVHPGELLEHEGRFEHSEAAAPEAFGKIHAEETMLRRLFIEIRGERTAPVPLGGAGRQAALGEIAGKPHQGRLGLAHFGMVVDGHRRFLPNPVDSVKDGGEFTPKC